MERDNAVIFGMELLGETSVIVCHVTTKFCMNELPSWVWLQILWRPLIQLFHSDCGNQKDMFHQKCWDYVAQRDRHFCFYTSNKLICALIYLKYMSSLVGFEHVHHYICHRPSPWWTPCNIDDKHGVKRRRKEGKKEWKKSSKQWWHPN